MGHSLAAWEAHYDKRGALRRSALAAAAFAALPLGGENSEPPARGAVPSESDADSEPDSGSDSEEGESGAPRGAGVRAPPPPGRAEPEQAGDGAPMPAAEGRRRAAPSGSGLRAAPAPAPSGATLLLQSGAEREEEDGSQNDGPAISLMGLQDLWDAPAPARGRRAALPPLAAEFQRRRQQRRFQLRPRPGGTERWLTAWEAHQLRDRGWRVLRSAMAIVLMASPSDPSWTPDVYIHGSDSRGARPNTEAMMRALCGGGAEWRWCARQGCSNCAEAKAAWAGRQGAGAGAGAAGVVVAAAGGGAAV